jgi:hypothetical protein
MTTEAVCILVSSVAVIIAAHGWYSAFRLRKEVEIQWRETIRLVRGGTR